MLRESEEGHDRKIIKDKDKQRVQILTPRNTKNPKYMRPCDYWLDLHFQNIYSTKGKRSGGVIMQDRSDPKDKWFESHSIAIVHYPRPV